MQQTKLTRMDQKFIFKLKEIIIKAGEIAVKVRDKGLIVYKKNDNSPVTNGDLETSNFIYKNLKLLDPAIPIICEEQPLTDISNSYLIWLVDPIDGTRSYIRNIDSFTVNIALICNQIPIIGLIYQPTLGKLYFTDHEGRFNAEQHGKTMRAVKREDDSFIAVVSSRNFNKTTEKYIFENNFSEVLAMPSSIKLCMIAEGSGDVYPKFGSTMEWDIAAGHALINASGGRVIDRTTGENMLYGKPKFENSDFIAFNKRYLTRKRSIL